MKKLTKKEFEKLGLTAENADLLLRSRKQHCKDLQASREIEKSHEMRLRDDCTEFDELKESIMDVRETRSLVELQALIDSSAVIVAEFNSKINQLLANQAPIKVIEAMYVAGMSKRELLQHFGKSPESFCSRTIDGMGHDTPGKNRGGGDHDDASPNPLICVKYKFKKESCPMNKSS
jgi:hypothetical protein